MKKRLLYIDTFSYEMTHEIFNSSSLYMFSLIFDEIEYYASKSSRNNTLSILKDLNINNINSRSIFYAKPLKSYTYYIFSIINAVLLIIKSRKGDVVYFNTNPLWAVRAINFLSRLMRRKVIINLHGEVEFLRSDKKLNAISQHELEYMFSDRFPISKTLYYCCLGEKIRENVLAIVPSKIGKHILSFGHTCVFSDILSTKSPEKHNSKIKIGIVGTINDIKSNFLDLLRFVDSIRSNDRIEIYAIGRIYCELEVLDKFGIKYIPEAKTRHLTRHEINNLLSRMNCIVYLYSSDSYRLSASGALFDAIEAEKIIISLRNDYFSDLFATRANAGLLFDDIDSIVTFLNSCESLPQLDYKSIKSRLSPQTEALLFSKKLKLTSIL